MRGRKGRIIKIEVTDYNILDIMADPAYMPFFVRRFHINQEISQAQKKEELLWSKVYKDNPKMLYDDCVDEIKRILGMQESSASQMKFMGVIKDIVLDACSDWITEKTGRTPEFEIYPNSVKSARINLKHYGHYIKDQLKEKERQSGEASSALDMGDPGASSI